jgi:hypothetical protein
LDPTDGFLSRTRVFIYKNLIVQIEPGHNSRTSFDQFITNKARQFFDGVFTNFNIMTNFVQGGKEDWLDILKKLIRSLYLHDQDFANRSKKKLTIVFESLSLETLSFLMLISNKFSFLKVNKSQDFYIKNDFEKQFQLNLIKNNSKWDASTFCLLISTNTRFEGVNSNLDLRQRIFRGNFKCAILGSLLNFTYPISFLGSNFNILKTISAGTNFICQDLKAAKNPFVVCNLEFFKRFDKSCIETLIKFLSSANVITKIWNGLNVISATATETGISLSHKFSSVAKKDLKGFSILYLINVNLNNLMNLKKITETKLLNFNNSRKTKCAKIVFNQNPHFDSNLELIIKLSKNEKNYFRTNYCYLPSSTFYENEETFISTEGNILKTNKLIFRKKTKNGWQILRKLFKNLSKHVSFISNPKDNDIIFFNSKFINSFRNYINFQFYATQNLTNTNTQLLKKNKSLYLTNSFAFSLKKIKTYITKMSYWLNDFFNGGRDEYSYKSLILQDCSSAIKLKTTNFF